jgi:hypothetical protein
MHQRGFVSVCCTGCEGGLDVGELYLQSRHEWPAHRPCKCSRGILYCGQDLLCGGSRVVDISSAKPSTQDWGEA